jgi:uncharacterized protein (DUF983 family)
MTALPPVAHPDTRPAATDDRPVGPALRHGWARQCPACGTGAMMQGFLTVRDACPSCGEDLHHQRADDGPAYLTILIVGKVVMGLFATVFFAFQPEPWVMTLGFSALALALSLYLLPRIKGAVVALQWSRRMHGFGGPEA